MNRKAGIAGANSALGLNYQYKSDYPKAIEYDYRRLLIFAEMGGNRSMAHLLRNIAGIYHCEQIYPKVLPLSILKM